MSFQKKILPLTSGTTISVANPNLDGTGTLGTVLTAANDGTLIEQIIIKGIGSSTQGMVRLFVGSGGSATLYKEVYITELAQTGTEPAITINLDEELILDSGVSLYASTQKAETFNVIAIASTWINGPCGSSCPTSISYTAATGATNINTANRNLDGTGAISTVLTATAGSDRGTKIPSITIKATGNTSEGMVRLYVNLAGTTYLFSEVQVPSTVQSGVVSSFQFGLITNLFLAPGDSLSASTEKADSFNIIAEGTDCLNCAFPE